MYDLYKRKQQQLNKEQVFEKLKHYCSYQQRCNSEVKNKLKEFTLSEAETLEVITELFECGFLNDERFAIDFARGKFKIKRWGKLKIKNALQQKLISAQVLTKALSAIDKKDYQKTFYLVADKKCESLSAEKNKFIKNKKLTDFLLQKGFEYQLIFEYLK